MKQRLGAFLSACLLVGVLFAIFDAMVPDSTASVIHVRVYPTADVEGAIAKINDLRLPGITAVRFQYEKNFAWFFAQTISMTVFAIIGTSLVLMVYTMICRMLKIDLKKGANS